MITQSATLNYLRIAPRKVRSVAALLRGLPVGEAEAQLLMQRRRAAKPLLKLLRSAVANAKQNLKLNPDKLVIESVRVDQGPMLKRHLPRARGMATPIQKKMSHIVLVLREDPNAKPPRFSIVVEKKTKLPKEGRAKSSRREKKEASESRPQAEVKRPGFLKRIFTRKTGAGA
ncbi:50S ribosomal protein L22 [Candidatus Parcubacteria bacterium]|nr:MAG: 50S ribosomal protein L22 [Candidatus Parcubacteria bacterium]